MGFFNFNFIFEIFTNFNSDDYVAIPFVKKPREAYSSFQSKQLRDSKCESKGVSYFLFSWG